MKKNCSLVFIFCAFLSFIFATSLSAQSKETYALIHLDLSPDLSLENLIQAGLEIDHYRKVDLQTIEFVLNEYELEILNQLGHSFEIVIEDLSSWHHQQYLEAQPKDDPDCGLSHFDQGSMGGYHTFTEVVDHLNAMSSEFPSLVALDTIGFSHEGRAVIAAKLSDNAALDESSTEGVAYFEALTHAREPLSMEVLLYYMWWLLENYGTNPEATYLINQRQIYFVPVVNPDGYVYNQAINPNGGGLWRKNRRENGDNCFGVDLNRNYSFGWGLNSGSSSNPCSNTFRGPAAFSEPETAAVRDLIQTIHPSIAFSVHTFGETFLSPFGYTDSLASYDLYAEFVSEFIPKNYIGYGTTAKMLGYTSSGTTRDYFHSEGILAWTPEAGQSFWESPVVLCDRVTEFSQALKYLSWVSGNYACYHSFTLEDNSKIWAGDTLSLIIKVKNRGLTQISNNVQVQINSLDGLLSPLQAQLDYGSIAARQIEDNTSNPYRIVVQDNVQLLDRAALEVIVSQEGTESYRDTIYLTIGERNLLFEDKGEDGMTNWITVGPGIDWDTSFMDWTSPQHSISDSRFGNYLPNSLTRVELTTPIDLSSMLHPRLEFNAKWSLEPTFDFTFLQISTDMGNSWSSLQGSQMIFVNNQWAYNENHHWIQEYIDLSPFINQQILIRFLLDSDVGVHSDGFYFDDFTIADYRDPEVVHTDSPEKEIAPMISIYPNPGEGLFYLHNNSSDFLPTKIQVFDPTGKIVFSTSTNLSQSSRSTIDLRFLDVGIYFFQVYTSETNQVIKTIIY